MKGRLPDPWGERHCCLYHTSFSSVFVIWLKPVLFFRVTHGCIGFREQSLCDNWRTGTDAVPDKALNSTQSIDASQRQWAAGLGSVLMQHVSMLPAGLCWTALLCSDGVLSVALLLCLMLTVTVGVCWWQLNGCEIRPGKRLRVNISIANVRLFVGNIPKNKSKEEILEEFRKHTGLSWYHFCVICKRLSLRGACYKCS